MQFSVRFLAKKGQIKILRMTKTNERYLRCRKIYTSNNARSLNGNSCYRLDAIGDGLKQGSQARQLQAASVSPEVLMWPVPQIQITFN